MASSLFMPSRVPYFALLLFCALAAVLECVHHCLTAQKLCRDDSTCSVLYYFVNENCGNYSESAICTAEDALSCKATLKALQIHKIFRSPCICTDEASDAGVQCHQTFNYIFKNPCLAVTEKAATETETLAKSEAEDGLRAPSCTYAFKICSENAKCKQIYEYFKRHCRVIDNICRPINRAKCEEAVAGIQLSPMFGCSCWHNDDRCEKIHQLINNNSCIGGFKTDKLARIHPFKNSDLWNDNPPTSTSSPSSLKKFSQILSVFSTSDEDDGFESQVDKPQKFYLNTPNPSITTPSKTEDGTTSTSSASSNVIISSKEQLPNSLPETRKRTERVTLPPQDSAQITIVTSTCTWAQETCEATSACQFLLERVYLACDENGVLCNRSSCMAAIRNFYHLGHPDKTFDIAFCNCRQEDSACVTSQRRLHPSCAISLQSHMPGCDEIAESCTRRDDCKHRLQNFVEACAVNRTTLQCQSSPQHCQKALVGILGTPLRTVCGCSGNNILSLYKCTDWQRTLWLNPCVVQAHREFVDTRSNQISQAPKPLMPALYTPKPYLNENSQYYHSSLPPQGHNPVGTMATFNLPTKIAPSPTIAQYCILPGGDSVSLKIRYGSGRRLYDKDPDCSSICMCDIQGVMFCEVLPCDYRISCQTSYAVYSHSAPAYQAYRGRCLCYSGKFICMKPSPQLYSLRQGVFLFLGYSELEERLLSPYTQMSILNAVKRIQELIDESQESNVRGLCKLQLYKHIGENIVMQAYLEKFETERKNNSMAESMILEEKEHCYTALRNLTDLINSNDPVIRNDVSLSLFKLSEVEVYVKEPTSGCSMTFSTQSLYYFLSATLTYILIISPALL